MNYQIICTICLQLYLVLVFFLVPDTLRGQSGTVKGRVYDLITNQPLADVQLELLKAPVRLATDGSGRFAFPFPIKGRDTIIFHLEAYISLKLPFIMEETSLDLGIIYLERDIDQIQEPQRVVLSEADLEVAAEDAVNIGQLSASNDLLARRAAFDLSPVFFKIRGYDSREGQVLINGISMNRVFNGRPQWNNWGGLNDVFRNKEVSLGLTPSPRHFGGVLGTTSMETRPGSLRPGMRMTASASNRIYTTRIMATYNKVPNNKGWGYTLSFSRRWAGEGYKDGTAYDAYSVYGALEFQFNDYSSAFITAFLASNIRGSSSAITREVYELAGRKYNPYWGDQQDLKRNSRLRDIQEPVVMLNYQLRNPHLFIEAGLSFQWGSQTRTRVGYYNAPNPNPDYYRNLPSYYINSPIGANLMGAEASGIAFVDDPQLNWLQLIRANKASVSAGRASYILYGDVLEERSIRGNFNTSISLGNNVYIDGGCSGFYSSGHYFSSIRDLLGAEYHSDIEPFSGTLNDMNGATSKTENEVFGYSYDILSHQIKMFAQLRLARGPWRGFLSGTYSNDFFQREGHFQNERFPDNSLGRGNEIKFTGYGIKGGVSFEFTKRHRIESNAMYVCRPPAQSGIFINPRDNNLVVPDIQNEKISSVDVSYIFRLPYLRGRVTAYYTRFQDLTEINFFFVDSGIGSDFVQQTTSGLDHLHKGLETGISFSPSSTIKLSAATSISRYLYASDPNVSINFDTAGSQQELINPEGKADLGISKLKDLKLSRGPSQAISIGIEYRHPKYWWISTTLNRLAENYIKLAPITRTQSFKIDPETGNEYPNIDKDHLGRLLGQIPLEEVYLLNLSTGKSWILGKKYCSVFLNITNLFDAVYRSGGFDQSRNGTYGALLRDRQGGKPSFGPKYWYGFGRTFFLNLSVSF